MPNGPPHTVTAVLCVGHGDAGDGCNRKGISHEIMGAPDGGQGSYPMDQDGRRPPAMEWRTSTRAKDVS